MKYNYHIIIIGGGSGGLVVASGASSLGAKVALIESEKMGGDCLNYGCIPSKTLLKSAHLAKEIQSSNKLGLNASIGKIDLSRIMGRVSEVIEEIEPHDSKERFEGLGVDVFLNKGRAKLLDRNTIEIGDKKITAKYIVIATGAESFIPNIKGLDSVDFLTNKTIFNLKEIPKRMIVLGAGAIGLELGQAFRHLGSEVTIVDALPSLFMKEDSEVALLMEEIFNNEDIKLELSANIIEIKKDKNNINMIIEKKGEKKVFVGDVLLVAAGRKPNTEGLNLDEVGVKTNKKGYIVTNKKLQTSKSNIYACGDVVGPYQFTHMAGYQAGIILRNIVFPFYKASVNYSVVPWTTFTKPEIAHVGYTEDWAKTEKMKIKTVCVDLKDIDRAKTENDYKGFLKLIMTKKGRLIGATLVGDKAGEIMPLATLAIKQKLKGTAFLSMIFSYPTEAEIFKFASLALTKKSFKPWMKTIIKKIFL